MLAHKKHQESLAAKQAAQKSYLLANYGDQSSHTNAPKVGKTAMTAPSASSTYIEYDPETGKPKHYVKTIAKSKYPEDVYPGNHSSVFGSWWRDGKWGFRCCHSFVKNSYCTGEDGIRGFEEEEAQRLGRNLIAPPADDGDDQQNQRDGDGKPVEVERSSGRKRRLDENGQGVVAHEGDELREKRARTEEAG